MAPDIKFSREIHEGVRGKDVIAFKRALSRARPDLYKWTKFSDYAGPFFMDAVVKWKMSQKGITNRDRVLGKGAQAILAKTHALKKSQEWAFDHFAISLVNDYYQTALEAQIRDQIVASGFYWYAHRAQIGYQQVRPYPRFKPPKIPGVLDCSGFYSLCSYAGGAPDPNHRGYDGMGYTGTLMDTGVRVGSVADLKKGDAIFYGSTVYASPDFPVGSPTHVALYVGDNKVLSMGHYPMAYVPYDYRPINHFRHYKVT